MSGNVGLYGLKQVTPEEIKKIILTDTIIETKKKLRGYLLEKEDL